MSDDKKPDDQAGAHDRLQLSDQASVVMLAGLPNKSHEESQRFYEQVVPTTLRKRFSGFYGMTDSDEGGRTITLFMHEGDKERPTLALQMKLSDSLDFADAVHEIRVKRYGRRIT